MRHTKMMAKIALCFLALMINVINYANCDNSKSLELIGSNCTLLEPLYNINFDLRNLHSDLGHDIKSDSNDKFSFNVCDKLEKKCNGKSNVAACLTKNNGDEIVLGTTSHLFLTNGRIHFNFSSGDPYKDGKNYTLNVVLMCDYSTIREPLSVIPYADNQYNFYIFWTTKSACSPLPTKLINNHCSVADATGYTYNLMSLSHVNHHVFDRNGSHFIVNVCKPVQYGYMAMCPPGSSICFVANNTKTINEEYLDYGQTDANPTIQNNRLVMNFNSNEVCDKTTNISSTIIFSCDPNNKDEGPEYVGKEGCKHVFSWGTPLACKKRAPCTAVDPITGFVFDMSSLSNKIYKASTKEDSYIFGICNIPNESACLGRSGACRLDKNGQSVGTGIINNTLLFNTTGSPYLYYSSGSICEKLKKYWSTKIEFICETDNVTLPSPTIAENGDCELIIQFETRLACQKQISCSVYNDSDENEINISALMNSVSNYEAKVNESMSGQDGIKYFLNVCRPLIPVYGLGCPGGSAACKATVGKTTPQNEQSLGFPDISLTIVNTPKGSRAQLKYLRGSKCEKDPALDLSSVIEFYCDPKAGDGSPILQEIMHDCHYFFEWATNIVCPAHNSGFRKSSCEIFNDEMNFSLDLKKITDGGQIKINSKSDSFEIDVCDRNISVVTDYAKRAVILYFPIKGNCSNNGKINVELKFICGASDHKESISDKESCHLVLTQETPLICPFFGIQQMKVDEKNETIPSHNDTHIKNPTMHHDDHNDDDVSVTVVVLITLTVVAMMAIAGYIVLKNPERRAYLNSLVRRRSVLVQYSRVRTNEEASLLLHTPGNISDSDDELLI